MRQEPEWSVGVPGPMTQDEREIERLEQRISDLSEQLEEARKPELIHVVPLTKGHHALVDESDVPLLEGSSWCADEQPGFVYAVTQRDKKKLAMHRIITGAEDGEIVDHINHNTLDNRRRNLRITDNSGNHYNRTPSGASRHLGVSKTQQSVRKKGWQASIKVNKKSIMLGYFETEAEAAACRRGAEKMLSRSREYEAENERLKHELVASSPSALNTPTAMRTTDGIIKMFREDYATLVSDSSGMEVAEDRAERAEQQLAEARAVLTLLEWGGDDNHETYCLVCDGNTPFHLPDCRLAVILKWTG